MKYMITGSTGADVRSFFPRLKFDTYDTLTQATQSAVDLVNRDLKKFGDGFHLKTGDQSWEILDSDNNSWERIQIKGINEHNKKNMESVDIDNSLHRLFNENKEVMKSLKNK